MQPAASRPRPRVAVSSLNPVSLAPLLRAARPHVRLPRRARFGERVDWSMHHMEALERTGIWWALFRQRR
ncbi:hypothetical protein HNR42_003101 [Deinobacterium chartae]|uniref:Uncharacterized protein n=1 Tax=Deinobacterium chartae TaxID=521158 RepID=A0A841I5C1_9DEIO|nr:hypothetical protein [Deinobacterium chartae]MBB6099648.1 hypothetical protein [Deinobacterium chartae]